MASTAGGASGAGGESGGESGARRYRVAIIGTGRPRREEGATGFGMSHQHARGYQASGQCEIVALADIRQENAEAFRQDMGIPEARIYEDYRRMLAEVQPDVVSITTWPHLHAEMTIAAAGAGARAVHCEKPMATTWGEARRMAQACEERGVQLTFNHQRRFEAKYRTARRAIQEGAVGQVLQIQAACSNLYDWGTHWFDMLFFYNGESPAEWVLGQIDSREERAAFGVKMESQGISYVGFANGVRGLLITGDSADEPPGGPAGQRNPLGAAHRIIGTEGMLEVVQAGGQQVRLLSGTGAGFRTLPLDAAPSESGGGGAGSGTGGAGGAGGAGGGTGNAIAAGIADLLRCLETGEEPELAARKALRATELIFATYESARRRGRVDLPLAIADNPFHTMLDRGEVGSAAAGAGEPTQGAAR